jgi:trehalose 6-phosphate synthase
VSLDLRDKVPLLIVLAALGWGASVAVHEVTQAWFMHEIALRARLASTGTQRALAAHLASGARAKVADVLEDLARDERILAAEVCTPQLATISRTVGFPEQFACEALRSRVPGTSLRTEQVLSDGAGRDRVHVSVHPIAEGASLRGELVLVHDVAFIERREGVAWWFTVATFAVFLVLAMLFARWLRRATWRTWTNELRRLIFLSFGPDRPNARPRDAFSPLLADVRMLVSELSAERRAEAAPWSAERLQRVLREHLRGDGVVILANRQPYSHERKPDGSIAAIHPASGLVTALEPVMRACSGTWVAHGSGSADRDEVDGEDRVLVPPGEESYALRRVWLTEEEQQGYYVGFSNEGLWPLCHVAHTRPQFRAADWHQYVRVNARFAEAACDEASGPDPVILVQDYHLALAPRLVRERLPRATLLTFWHVPWPNPERFGICPRKRELLEGLLGSSIVGFHTQQHCNNFLDAVDRYLEARIDRERQAVVVGGREVLVRSYPISIEWPNAWAAAAPAPAECRRAVLHDLGLRPDALLGVGVDRLDYTKGIEERLAAVERALERFPDLRGRFTFVQLAAPSRSAIESYRALDARVEAQVARIQRRFGTDGYQPAVLLRAHHQPPDVFRFLRAADVCYVSSVHDGMNLVAKEFVAAREDEQGVLVLSQFTGAARELTEALVVNPYDVEEASSALAAALSMPPEQQRERMRAMRGVVAEFNVYRWAGRMIEDAGRVRQRGRLTDRLGPARRDSTGGAA